MPTRDVNGQRLWCYEVTPQNWIVWNHETESWEPMAQAKWFECGVVLERVNAVCTKFIGHRGEHGQRDS